jgi:hypothetical protein
MDKVVTNEQVDSYAIPVQCTWDNETGHQRPPAPAAASNTAYGTSVCNTYTPVAHPQSFGTQNKNGRLGLRLCWNHQNAIVAMAQNKRRKQREEGYNSLLQCLDPSIFLSTNLFLPSGSSKTHILIESG